jgi:hypothetical protein
MGTASLVLGILGVLGCCTFLFSILAIVFGVQGRKKASQGLATNGGMATAGLILGIVGVALGVIYWIWGLVNADYSFTS